MENLKLHKLVGVRPELHPSCRSRSATKEISEVVRYLFDTNTCSYVINRRKGFESVTRRMDGLRYGELILSSIVLAELQFMVAKSAVPQGKRDQLLRFLLQFHVAPFDEAATLAHGQVRH